MGIALREVDFSYGDRPILQDFTLEFPESGVVCLFGPSGCGKTTILRLLAGLERPDRGRIEGMEAVRVSMVFQENRLLPWMSAADNVAAVLEGKESKPQAARWLRLVGLEDPDQPPSALSGGMKRRVAIARALAAPGELLLMDEPFTGIDDGRREEISRLILDRFAGRLILLVTHDEDECALLGGRLLRLPAGPQTGHRRLEESDQTPA